MPHIRSQNISAPVVIISSAGRTVSYTNSHSTPLSVSSLESSAYDTHPHQDTSSVAPQLRPGGMLRRLQIPLQASPSYPSPSSPRSVTHRGYPWAFPHQLDPLACGNIMTPRPGPYPTEWVWNSWCPWSRSLAASCKLTDEDRAFFAFLVDCAMKMFICASPKFDEAADPSDSPTLRGECFMQHASYLLNGFQDGQN
ncbi:hypothetical protein CC86DRAFT_14688 [Ophiobolus disseminans]|uniref:Uncharacterized protein n=1 Tax=Ophiobolus disseminans TaxID=1469910 RepID=A0A6A7AMB4_9PLEO|nr:hypothetical protein CC86DRAFT_14688 [Ophiobolus disseminans]